MISGDTIKKVLSNSELNLAKKCFYEILHSNCYYYAYTKPFQVRQQINHLEGKIPFYQKEEQYIINDINFLIRNLKTKKLEFIEILPIATPIRVYNLYLEIENYSLLGILVKNHTNYNMEILHQKIYIDKGLTTKQWFPI